MSEESGPFRIVIGRESIKKEVAAILEEQDAVKQMKAFGDYCTKLRTQTGAAMTEQEVTGMRKEIADMYGTTKLKDRPVALRAYALGMASQKLSPRSGRA